MNKLTLNTKTINVFGTTYEIKHIKEINDGHFQVVAEADLYDGDNKTKGKVEIKIPCIREDGLILPYEGDMEYIVNTEEEYNPYESKRINQNLILS